MKITCSICKNEENKMCKVKRIGVHLNKRRDCNKFVLSEDKVKPSHLVKTISMPYAEKEALKHQYKEELRRYREMEKATKEGRLDTAFIQPRDVSHPLTGDLSRFTSTAAKE